MLNYQNLKHISKLETKTLWSIAAIIIMVNMGVGIALGLISSHKYKQNLSEHYNKLAVARAQVLVEPIWTFEFERAQFLLNELISDNNILEAKIQADKEIITSTRNAAATTSSQTFIAPIVFKTPYMNEPLGQLAMTISTDEAGSILTRQIAESIIISLFLLLILSIGISRITTRQLRA